MAYIGVRKPYIAPFDAQHPGKYLATKFAGKAVSFEETPNASDATLYADDVIAESDRGVTSYGLTLGASHLDTDVEAAMFGHASNQGLLTSNVDDTPPYVGFATIGVKMVGGVKKYEARVYPKTQWTEPGVSINTRGESTEFQTQSINGISMADDDGNLRFKEDFATEAEAVTFITGKFPLNA